MWRRTGQYQQMHEGNKACISAAKVSGAWMFSGWLRDEQGRWQCQRMEQDAAVLKEWLESHINGESR